MTDGEITGPYEAHPTGRNDESGVVYKIGPRGGRYYVARYWYLATAQSVARTLNVFHELEMK